MTNTDPRKASMSICIASRIDALTDKKESLYRQCKGKPCPKAVKYINDQLDRLYALHTSNPFPLVCI